MVGMLYHVNLVWSARVWCMNSARARMEALPETACEEWEEAVARKDGREKKYWFSQARNESVWKEPHKYYPVRFAQPE